jgi:hypothetical protein
MIFQKLKNLKWNPDFLEYWSQFFNDPENQFKIAVWISALLIVFGVYLVKRFRSA